MMKTIAFVETTASALGLANVYKAVELGYQVIFVTESLDFYLERSGSIGKKYIESFHDIVLCDNTYDWLEIISCLAGKNIDGLITFGDYHLEAVSKAANHLKLPHCDVAAIANCRDKYLVRKVLSENGIAMPFHQRISSVSQLELMKLTYPLIVKPIDDSGSVKIRKVGSYGELKEAIQEVLSHKVNARGARLKGEAIIEHYLQGEEMSVELINVKGLWQVIGITAREMGGPIGATETSTTFPYKLNVKQTQLIHRTVTDWLERLNLNFGGAHVEIKLEGDNIHLIEVNPRPAGGRVNQLIQLASTYDPIKELIKLSVGDEPSHTTLPVVSKEFFTCSYIYSNQDGVIDTIHIPTDLIGSEGVIDIAISKEKGEYIKKLETNYDYLGYVLCKSASVELSRQLAERAKGKIKLLIS